MAESDNPWRELFERARALNHTEVAAALCLERSPTDRSRYKCPKGECDCLAPLTRTGRGSRWLCYRCGEAWSHLDLAMEVWRQDKFAALQQLLTATGHAPVEWPVSVRPTVAGAYRMPTATAPTAGAAAAAVRLPDVSGLSKRDAALAYYDAGLCVIPTRAESRKPLVKWGQYQDERPSREDVRAWWDLWPEANIQVVAGSVSGVIAVDLDGDTGKRNGAELAGGQLPEDTPLTLSGGGGVHLFYRHPGGDTRVPCVSGTPPKKDPHKIPPHLVGVELKGDGGLIVVPPSTHYRTGREYVQVQIEHDVAPLPPWLEGFIRNRVEARAIAPMLGSLAAHIDAGALREALSPERRTIHLAEAGLGRTVDRLLGGGLLPGNVTLVVAQRASGGKTAWITQGADGVAAQSATAFDAAAGAGTRPRVTPVLFVTEMPERDLMWRSLARLSGKDSTLLRAPNSYRGSQQESPDGPTMGQRALQDAWRQSDEYRSLGRFVKYVARGDNPGQGLAAVRRLEREIAGIRSYWGQLGADAETVLLVIDPLHRLAESDEVSAQGELIMHVMDLVQREGVIALVASDTTKEAARNRDEAGVLPEHIAAEMAVRGSYQLIHAVDFALSVRILDPENDAQAKLIGNDWLARHKARPLDNAMGGRSLYADIVSAKERWGRPDARAAYWFDAPCLRFVPMEPVELPRANGGAPGGAALSNKSLSDLNKRGAARRGGE